VHVTDQLGVFEQVEDQRGRYVVGQVADDAQAGRLLAEPAEVELQGVALVQVEVLAPGELGLQDGDQVQVELDDIQLGAAVEQPFGEGTLPGPISTSRSPGLAWIARRMRWITPASCRKFWPKRLRARCW